MTARSAAGGGVRAAGGALSRPALQPVRIPLTRERILRAAVEVADAEGLDAVTLRRLAEALGVHPTSLYNHLPSKEAILDGMLDILFAEAQLAPTVADWRAWVREFAGAMRKLARAHPGAFQVFTRRPAQGPVASAHSEAALDSFRRAGFSPLQARDAVLGTALALLGLALNETPSSGPWMEPDLGHLSAERHPRIFEAYEAWAAQPADGDGAWRVVVESLIIGLGAALPER